MSQQITQQTLIDLKPTKEFFIGIDSDGCVFDTMEIKQKECFCPNVIKYFNLQVVQKYARETWEFVNLYSQTRGCNRFLAVERMIELLGERKEVKARNARMPDISELKDWLKKETKLGNPTLQKLVDQKPTPFLKNLMAWSKQVNKDIESMVFGMPPFPFVIDCINKMNKKADSIVVSQTPVEALVREWEENKMEHLVRLIAGQEVGTKTEHLKFAAVGKYPANKILMIGDAMGDLKAAKANGVFFFPVNPGHEEASWERLFKEGLDKFFGGKYEGAYEKSLIEQFQKYLPEKPAWK
jgi:phosphoglycolate phosphatase-like HAD superfamily hydrolase